MSPRVQFGIAIPQTFVDAAVSTSLIREVILRAEQLGFHSLWVQEETLGSSLTLDPIELLTYAAAVTHRIRLGTAVLLTAVRGPVHLAKSLATLDQLSDGRLIVGVGLGQNVRDYPAYGLSSAQRIARFQQGIELMRRLWTEPAVTFESPFWTLEVASLLPKPVQQPHPPIWIGARRPAALHRAVEVGDGFIGAGASSLAEFAEAVRILRGVLAARNQDPALFSISKRVYVAVDRDSRRAEQRLEKWLSAFYRTPGLATGIAVWGAPAECVTALSHVVAAGADLIILNPVFDEREQIERLAQEVIPSLQERLPPF